MRNTNNILDISKIYTQSVKAPWLSENDITLDVLRLDVIHEVVSGNKWFKLKHYLQDAITANKSTIATFGGAWSNHIVATAYAAQNAGFKSVGIIRGEEPSKFSISLQNALAYNMRLIFVTREEYKDKDLLIEKYAHEDWYWIQEGGYGLAGARGIKDIINGNDLTSYDYIITAVGTGTTLAGLVSAGSSSQHFIGISSMKGNYSLKEQVNFLLPEQLQNHFTILHEYHFGGYGKHSRELIEFMNDAHARYQLPLDFVYTAKTFYATQQLTQNDFFTPGSSVLMVHTGGLQGNKSLAPEVLAF